MISKAITLHGALTINASQCRSMAISSARSASKVWVKGRCGLYHWTKGSQKCEKGETFPPHAGETASGGSGETGFDGLERTLPNDRNRKLFPDVGDELVRSVVPVTRIIRVNPCLSLPARSGDRGAALSFGPSVFLPATVWHHPAMFSPPQSPHTPLTGC
jgi:hypothetical protein